VEHDDEDIVEQEAYLDRLRWKAWCDRHSTWHHYLKAGRQPSRCPDSAEEVILRPAGPFSPSIDRKYRLNARSFYTDTRP
jgi:hypothetical protein